MTETARQFQTYQHYKGGVYFKLAEGMHTETEEALTIYTCAVSGLVFCRPTAMFNEIITEDGYTGPRFIPLPPNTVKAQRKTLKYYDNHPDA
jgi:hypothetical protein